MLSFQEFILEGTDLTIANTIVDQLGGNKFKTMVGVKTFVGQKDGATF